MPARKQKRAKDAPPPNDDCNLPTQPPVRRLKRFVRKRAFHEVDAIREYVEWQAKGEKVLHLEKVATERLRERRLDASDVRTDKERYWVITNPTNLYRHEDFHSLDFLI